MNTRRQPDRTGASTCRRILRPLLGALLLLIAWGSATPAGAESGTISGPRTGPIFVNWGETLNIVDGAQISGGDNSGVYVNGGTVNVSGGLVSGNSNAIFVTGGTLNISGGTVSGGLQGVQIRNGATLNMTGGSVSASDPSSGVGVVNLDGTATIAHGSIYGGWVGLLLQSAGTTSVAGGSQSGGVGIIRWDGALTISGCNLRLEAIPNTFNQRLVGALLDGSLIDTSTNDGVGPGHLDNRSTGAIQVSCPSDMVVPASPGACSASLNPGIATASDGCLAPPAVTWQRSDQLALTAPYPIGTTTITWTATNALSDSLFCIQTITVKDAPTITLNGSSPMTVECGTSFSDPGATATTCAGSVPVDSTGSVDTSTPGSYTLTYTAIDPSGNAAPPVTRTVTVVDTTAPVITPPANINQAADPGQCSAVVNLGAATAADTCAGDVTPQGTRSDGQALTAPYPVGTTTITWMAADAAGNPVTATQTITVNDTQPPTLSCPGNQTVETTSTGAVVNFQVGATDNCPGVSVSAVPPSGSTFPVGTTTVNCTASDAHGNSSTCSFTVTVTPIGADLSVTQTAGPSPVSTGSDLTYTIDVSNAGPQAAQDVVLTDPLPPGSLFVSASASVGTLTTPRGKNDTVTWNVGTLASGESVTLTLVVKVSAKAGTTLTNTASVSSSTQDPAMSNNSTSVATLVAPRR